MSAVPALQTTKFLRKTTLGAAEANKNFKMLDNDVADAVTSVEADRVTPLMSKIYMRLLLTPEEMREGERILRFAGEEREGKWVTAWEQLRSHLRVSGETASKALKWMHGQGIIGYYAGKNGVGIRIFLNRAASSITPKKAARPQKILSFARASDTPPRTSLAETPFNDSFAVREILDTDKNPCAPKNGADAERLDKIAPSPSRLTPPTTCSNAMPGHRPTLPPDMTTLEDVITRLRAELEPTMHAAARQAAEREHERTRDWLEKRGLPKAARVAQHEAYNLLRKYGLISETSRPSRSQSEVGRNSYAPPDPHPLSDEEVNQLAQACLAMLETQGRSIQVTLSEMSSEAGGFLLPHDAGRVSERVKSLLSDDDSTGKREEERPCLPNPTPGD